MEHVHVVTPLDEELSAGIVCFEVDGLPAPAVVERLTERNIVATTTPYAVEYPRLSPAIYITPEEVDIALREVRDLS